MPAFRRLELWSNLQCASGTRLAIVPRVASLSDTRSVNSEESLDALLFYNATLMASLAEMKVLRVVYTDDTFDEWRITDIVEGREPSGEPLVRVKGSWPLIDLAGFSVVRRVEVDGTVRQNFEVLGLTPQQHLDSFILPAITAWGGSYVASGTVTPTAPVNLVYDWDSPLTALRRLAEQTGMELRYRRNGTSQYLVDLIDQIGSGAAVVPFRTARNLTSVKRTRSTNDLVTHVYPKGAAEDDINASIAHARWKVTNIASLVLTLADPVGGDGPLLMDDQLNGYYLRNPAGTLTQITDSSASAQTVTVASATGYAVNDLVELRLDSSGTELVFLPNPAGYTAYGARVAVLDRSDIPGTVNLVANPAQRAWAGASNVPADSWAKVGSCTVTKTTTATRWRVGAQSTRVETAADGVGLEVANVTVAPTTASPYFSGYVSLQIASGKVRLELVCSDGSTTWVIPSGTENKAWSNVVGTWVDLGISGIDLKALGTGCTTARLRVVQDGAGTADFYVDCAQLTQSAGQLPFIEGSGGTQLWQEANRFLEQNMTPGVRYDVDILDLNRLNPTTWSADALTLGATVAVYDGELSLVASTRVLELTRDILVEADTKCVLSNRPEDLTDALVRPQRARRITREAESSSIPVITPYYSRINGTPFQALVTLQATPVGCTIYKWVGLSSDTVPIAGSASYSVYASPVTVNLAASATYNGVVACYAVIGSRQSPVQVFNLPLSPEPLAPVTLSEPVGGTLRISWSPNAWVRRVRVYRRTHATLWPTTGSGGTSDPLDSTYFVAEMNVTADGGGFDAAGAAIPGGTLLENTGWTNGQVARVIVVPMDELDNVGARATANLTMTGAAAAALTAASNSANSNGTNCGTGATRNFSWTPNGSVADGTHDLKVYVAADGGTPTLLFTETSPATVTSKTNYQIPSVDGISPYIQGSGTNHTFAFTYELIKTSDSSVVDSGSMGQFLARNTCV